MKRIVLFLLVSLLLSLKTMGQEDVISKEPVAEKNKARPRVALVLSGGGAKGMAHIGVLKVLERAGIPVDIITGTSMGSIVGGLYACGNRAQRLDSIVRAQDWTYVLSDREDLSHQSLHEREKQNTYIISKSMTLKKKAATEGGGLIMGKNILTLFDVLTAPYNDSIDFNRLPIPFACVATDIVDNTEHVFHSGVLSQAMRASMSIPGAFTPVRMGEKVLVDGGMRNNYPADVAREMGADVIIGVSVQEPLKTASELTSTGDVLLQIVDHNCKNKYDENWNMTDIPIRVNVEGYNTASFSQAAIDTLIRRGEEAAMEHWDELQALHEKLGGVKIHPRLSTVRIPLPSTGRYKIGRIIFENMTSADEAFIRAKFRLREGDSIDNDRADIITTSIRQDLYYSTARFRIQNNSDRTAASVTFTAGEKKKNQMKLGMRFDTEEILAMQANVEMPLKTQTPMDIELTLRLGKRNMMRADWSFHPRSFFRPTVSYAFRHNDVSLYEYGKKSFGMTYNQHSAALSIFNFNVRNFNVRIGANWDYYHYSSVLVDRLPEHTIDMGFENQSFVSYQGQVDYNCEDDWYFPMRGTRFTAHFGYYTDNFVKLDDKVGLREYSASWRMSFPIGSHFSFQPMLYGRLLCTPAEESPVCLGNMMGGEWFGHYYEQQMPFAGVGFLEQAWDKMVAAQLQGQLHLTESSIFLLRMAAGQDAQTFRDLFKHRTMLGCSASYYFNSVFGPLGGTVGYSNLTKKVNCYINLGFVF